MSEITEPKDRLTKEQCFEAIIKLAGDNGYQFVMVAVANRTGEQSSVIGFLPDTHTATIDLVEAK